MNTMTDEELQAHVRAIVDAAPPLSDDQRALIASVLRPAWLEHRRKAGADVADHAELELVAA